MKVAIRMREKIDSVLTYFCWYERALKVLFAADMEQKADEKVLRTQISLRRYQTRRLTQGSLLFLIEYCWTFSWLPKAEPWNFEGLFLSTSPEAPAWNSNEAGSARFNSHTAGSGYFKYDGSVDYMCLTSIINEIGWGCPHNCSICIVKHISMMLSLT